MARTKSILFPNSLSEFEPLFDKLQRAQVNQLLNAGGLVIKAGGSAVVKTVNTIKVMVDGVLISKAAADMAALVGTVAADAFNVYVFTVNAAGTLATQMGTPGATLGAVVFPTIAEGKVVIGFIIVNPTGTGDFVGGTTPLADGTVVPNVVYIDTVGSFLPELSTL